MEQRFFLVLLLDVRLVLVDDLFVEVFVLLFFLKFQLSLLLHLLVESQLDELLLLDEFVALFFPLFLFQNYAVFLNLAPLVTANLGNEVWVLPLRRQQFWQDFGASGWKHVNL